MKIERVNRESALYAGVQYYATANNLFFHSEKWLNCYDPLKLVQCAILNNNNEITGCFLYYVFRKAVFSFVISPPYTPHIALHYLNPAQSTVNKNSYSKEISALLSDYFSALGADYININLPDTMVDTQPFIWAGYTARARYTYLLALDRSEEELWNNLSGEKRKSINKAVKDGLLVERTQDAELIFGLVTKSLSRNDRSKNMDILQRILRTFAGTEHCIAYTAGLNDQALAVGFSLLVDGKAMYLFGGFDAGNKHHGAGVSCMWKSILAAKETGMKIFDFEGSMNPSIERYFREFGGELKPYHCIEKIKPVLNILLRIKKHQPY